MDLKNWLSTPFGIYWITVHGVLTFLAACIVYWLQRKLFKRIHAHFIKTPHVWDDTLVHALSLPLSLGIWMFAVGSFVEYRLSGTHHAEWMQEVIRLRDGCFILLLIWFFWHYSTLVEYRLVHLTHSKRKIDTNTIATAGRFVRIGLGTMVLLIILETIGVPLKGVIAFGGGGALVMGIAAQHILANWFGGLMIFLDKPFKPNEWISSPDRNIEGKVVEIGWRTTKIIGPDNRPLYIPNSIFSQVIIANSQRITHRKIEATIGLRYEDAGAIRDVVKSIDAMLRAYPSVDPDERFMVDFVGFGDSALNIQFLCSVKESDFNTWRSMQQDIFLKVIDIIIEHKAQLAYPTVLTHLPENYSLQQKLTADKKKNNLISADIRLLKEALK